MKKQIIGILMLSVFVIVGVTAGLVDYLSNTVTGTINVESPITITVDGGNPYNINMYGGESKSINVETTIHVDGVTGHIAENKIVNFDGIGMTVYYEDTQLESPYFGYIWELPVCVIEEDSYYYIGDPTETLSKGSFTSKITFNAELDLDPAATYNVESRAIMANKAACTIPTPIHIAP